MRRAAGTPAWVRLTISFCLLFLLCGAVAQVSHDHSAPSQLAGKHQSVTDCQLCVAMSSAQIAQAQQAPVGLESVEGLLQEKVASARVSLWRSDLVIRPPPSVYELAS